MNEYPRKLTLREKAFGILLLIYVFGPPIIGFIFYGWDLESIAPYIGFSILAFAFISAIWRPYAKTTKRGRICTIIQVIAVIIAQVAFPALIILNWDSEWAPIVAVIFAFGGSIMVFFALELLYDKLGISKKERDING